MSDSSEGISDMEKHLIIGLKTFAKQVAAGRLDINTSSWLQLRSAYIRAMKEIKKLKAELKELKNNA